MNKNIKTYEDACADLGKDPLALPDYSKAELSPAEERFNLAVFKLSRILVSLNKDEQGNLWKPGPSDPKWYTWMYIVEDATKPSGLGLSFRASDCAFSLANVASRLTARTSEIARYVFDTFKDLFEDMILFLE